MMKIELTNVGKRFNKEWIFRKVNFQFETNKHYAIIGPNGSGKSTLLQIIGGSSFYNEGNINYDEAGKAILPEKIFRKISFAAPYLELIEEMNLSEFFSFHQEMKGWLDTLTTQKIIQILQLEKSAFKQLRYYSSGMKQRVKLAQAFFSNVPVVLLDEPLTNLDEEGIQLYHLLIKHYCDNRTIIISSNDKNEYSFCEKIIDLRSYK